MRTRTQTALAIASLALGACGGGSSEACTAAELEAALASAPPGAVVMVGACTIEGGPFVVDRGITLRGHGATSVLAGSRTVVALEGAGGTIESLDVETRAVQGIVSIDAASVVVRDVEVRATLGRVAIGLDGVATARLENVTLVGPVTPATAPTIPADPGDTQTAMFGLVLVDVPEAILTDVEIRGFGRAGLAASGSTFTWTRGTAPGNLRLGAWLSGCDATFEDLTLGPTLRGLQLQPTAAIMALGSEVTTTRVQLPAGEGGFGALHDGGSALHEDLVAGGHAAGGVAAQHVMSLELRGGMLEGNHVVGVLANDVESVVLGGVTIRSTVRAMVSVPPAGMIEVGDGLQIVGPTTTIDVGTSTFEGNARVGILTDLGGGDTSGMSFTDVNVDAPAMAFGCVAQNGTTAAGWDTGVTRTAAAAAADGTFTGGMDVHTGIPMSDFPSGTAIAGAIAPIM
jgi:hypothetical protein